jgi:hypothetical protein
MAIVIDRLSFDTRTPDEKSGAAPLSPLVSANAVGDAPAGVTASASEAATRIRQRLIAEILPPRANRTVISSYGREMAPSAPTLQLLEWIGERDRSYAETMDVWHSHCPRLTIWEDAVSDGLVEVRGGRVRLTEKGWGQAPAGSDPD